MAVSASRRVQDDEFGVSSVHEDNLDASVLRRPCPSCEWGLRCSPNVAFFITTNVTQAGVLDGCGLGTASGGLPVDCTVVASKARENLHIGLRLGLVSVSDLRAEKVFLWSENVMGPWRITAAAPLPRSPGTTEIAHNECA